MQELKRLFEKVGGVEIFRQYIRSRVLFVVVVEVLVLGLSRKALELLRMVTDYKLYTKLSKNYKKKIDAYMLENSSSSAYTKENSKIIWVCWFQGLNSAPEIVKICISSLMKNLPEYDIRVITNENYSMYVTLPDYILEKRKKNIIGLTHFSDLIRLELLLKYGGTWIDSTVLCTSRNIPNYMLNSDLFVFQNLKPGCNGQTRNASNWFISAKPGNRVLKLTLWLLYEYWSSHNSLVNYFIFHFFFQMALARYPEERDRVIPFSNALPHIILLRLASSFDENVYSAVKEQTPFHKLTYKYEKIVEGSFLDHILNEYR